jgi:hypothetical protein
MKSRKARFGPIALVSLLVVTALPMLLAGCSAQQTALKAQGVVSAVLKVAAAEEAVVPAADQAAFTSWVSLGNTLNAQLATCITNVGGVTGKGAKFAACFSTFASGLLSPAELAQLRVLSPSTQAKVQLYVTAIVTGINVVTAITAPQVAERQPTRGELEAFAARIGYAGEYSGQ